MAKRRRSMGGVSWVEVGADRFKLVWRQWETEDGQRVRRQRYRTVSGAAARDELATVIRRDLDTKGFHEPEARPERKETNLEQAAAAWMRHKAARGAADTTIEVHASVFTRFFRTARSLLKIAKEEVVPGSALTRDLFSSALLAWKDEGLSEQRRYDLARVVYEMWRWVADDPDKWPSVPKPPRDSTNVLPPPPVRTGASIAPTWAETDAILRRARESRSKDADLILAVCRYTGLRVGQALGIKAGDLDVDRATLRVRVGKSRREKAEKRLIPISRHLVALLQPLLDHRDPAEHLFPSRTGGLRPAPTGIDEIWAAATKAKEVREETWKPVNRNKCRTTHAFRAAFLSELRRAGVAPEVRHALVGHASATTEDRHYSGPDDLFTAMRAAVDAIPPVDWEGPKAQATDKVVPMKRAGR